MLTLEFDRKHPMDSTHPYTEDDLALFRKLFDGKKPATGSGPIG